MEKEYIQKRFCKHQGNMVNQGIIICTACHNPVKCNTCEYREPEEIVVKLKTT